MRDYYSCADGPQYGEDAGPCGMCDWCRDSGIKLEVTPECARKLLAEAMPASRETWHSREVALHRAADAKLRGES